MSTNAPVNCFNIHYNMSKVDSWKEIATKLDANCSDVTWYSGITSVVFPNTIGGVYQSQIKYVYLSQDLTITFNTPNVCQTLSFYQIIAESDKTHRLKYKHYTITKNQVIIPRETLIALSTWEIQINEQQRYYRYNEETFGTITPSGLPVSETTQTSIAKEATISDTTINYSFPLFGVQSKRMSGVGGKNLIQEQTENFFTTKNKINFNNLFTSDNSMHFNYYPYKLKEILWKSEDSYCANVQWRDTKKVRVEHISTSGSIETVDHAADSSTQMIVFFIQENNGTPIITQNDDLKLRISEVYNTPTSFDKLQQTCFKNEVFATYSTFTWTGNFRIQMKIPTKITAYQLLYRPSTPNPVVQVGYWNISNVLFNCTVLDTTDKWINTIITYNNSKIDWVVENGCSDKWFYPTEDVGTTWSWFLIGDNLTQAISADTWEQTKQLVTNWTGKIGLEIKQYNRLFDYDLRQTFDSSVDWNFCSLDQQQRAQYLSYVMNITDCHGLLPVEEYVSFFNNPVQTTTIENQTIMYENICDSKYKYMSIDTSWKDGGSLYQHIGLINKQSGPRTYDKDYQVIVALWERQR